MKNNIAVSEIWGHIKDAKCKPIPLKNVIVEAFDEISQVAGNKSVDDIVRGIVLGESNYKKLSKTLSTSDKDYCYDDLTVRKKGLFPGLPPTFATRFCEIARIYYRQRFIMEHGLPPYEEGKINIPVRKTVKRPKEKLQHNCPNCGYLLTGKR